MVEFLSVESGGGMRYSEDRLRTSPGSAPAGSPKPEILGQIPLFAALSPAERQALGAFAVQKHYAAGDTLFSEGDPCEGLYVIAEGMVKIVKTSAAGREIMLAVESAPQSIAEVPLFDGGNYPASAVALRDTVVYLLLNEDFQRFCRQHPEVPLKILAVVGRRLRTLVGLVEMVTFGSVRQRLARMLLEFHEQSGDDVFALPVTHEELALRLGTVREVVSRNLSRFQAEGFLRIQRRQIELLDAAALRAESETEF